MKNKTAYRIFRSFDGIQSPLCRGCIWVISFHFDSEQRLTHIVLGMSNIVHTNPQNIGVIEADTGPTKRRRTGSPVAWWKGKCSLHCIWLSFLSSAFRLWVLQLYLKDIWPRYECSDMCLNIKNKSHFNPHIYQRLLVFSYIQTINRYG